MAALTGRDRLSVLAGLAGVVVLSWAYLLVAAAEMGGMADATAMIESRPWSGAYFALMFLMWSVMMVAMMLPSAAPMVLLYAAVVRKLAPDQHAGASVGAFVLGYAVAWTAFGLGATGLQWILEKVALVSAAMVTSSAVLGGLLLVAAGIYQWTPAKEACLKHCRAPLGFLSQHWRAGPGGALRMGVAHGGYCIGCCWLLMGLLFVGGVMNLLWVAAIAIFVLLEKTLPWGSASGRVAGGLLVIAGGAVIAGAA